MALSTSTMLGSHHHYLVLEIFHNLKRKFHAHEGVSPHSFSFQLLAMTNLLSVCMDLPVLDSYTNDIIQYVTFGGWLFPLHNVFKIHVCCSVFHVVPVLHSFYGSIIFTVQIDSFCFSTNEHLDYSPPFSYCEQSCYEHSHTSFCLNPFSVLLGYMVILLTY